MGIIQAILSCVNSICTRKNDELFKILSFILLFHSYFVCSITTRTYQRRTRKRRARNYAYREYTRKQNEIEASHKRFQGILAGHSVLIGVQYRMEESIFSGDFLSNNNISQHYETSTTSAKLGIITGYQYITAYNLLIDTQVGLSYIRSNVQSDYRFQNVYSSQTYHGIGVDVALLVGYYLPFKIWGIAIKTGVGYVYNYTFYENNNNQFRHDHIAVYKIGLEFNRKRIIIGVYADIPIIHLIQQESSTITLYKDTYSLESPAGSSRIDGDWSSMQFQIQVGYRF